MDTVYLLLHKRKGEEEVDKWIFSTIIVGIYSSFEKVQETIERYTRIEGFRDFPNDFVAEEYQVELNNLPSQRVEKKSVFLLQHFYEEGEYENITRIDVHFSEDKARQFIQLFKTHPEFIDHPDGFHVDEYIIDEDNWTEGFFTFD